MTRDKVSPEMKAFWDETVEKQEKEVLRMPFEVIQGGLPPKRDNWLVDLEEKTVFFCREKTPGTRYPRFLLVQYMVVKKFEKTIVLLNSLNAEEYVSVYPSMFCNEYDLWEIVYDPKTMPPLEYPKVPEEEETLKNP